MSTLTQIPGGAVFIILDEYLQVATTVSGDNCNS